MAEVLTTPVQQLSKDYQIVSLYLNWVTSHIEITLQASDGSMPVFKYDGDIAKNILSLLLTANLTLNSLHKRILKRLNDDGLLVGVISGVPQ
jgi:hypothetical protein